MSFRVFQQFDAYFYEQITLLGDYATNLKLYPSVITRSSITTSASPWFPAPRHRLYGRDSSICQFSDPSVDTHLPVFAAVIVIITVFVDADDIKLFLPVGIIILGLHVSPLFRIIRPCRVPQHAFDGHRPRASVTRAFRLHANKRCIVV